MSKSRNDKNRRESNFGKVAQGTKRVIMSEQNRRERKQADLWKRQWNEELLSDMQ